MLWQDVHEIKANHNLTQNKKYKHRISFVGLTIDI